MNFVAQALSKIKLTICKLYKSYAKYISCINHMQKSASAKKCDCENSISYFKPATL